jgi:hypothetical protein
MGRRRSPTPIYEINEYIESTKRGMGAFGRSLFTLSEEEATERINRLIFTLMDLNTWYVGCSGIFDMLVEDTGSFAGEKRLWNAGSSGVNDNPTFMTESPQFGSETLFREFGEGKGVTSTILDTVSGKQNFQRQIEETMDFIDYMFKRVEGSRSTSVRIQLVIDMVRAEFPDLDLVVGYDRIGLRSPTIVSEELEEDEKL